MKKLKTGLSILVFILILAYALAFAINNNQTLALDFLVGEPISWPSALWLGIMLVVGVALGLLSGLVVQTKQKLHIRRLNKQLEQSARANKLP